MENPSPERQAAMAAFEKEVKSGDPIAIGRELAERFNSERGSGYTNSGRKNAYRCDVCGSYMITVDREPGVTPFMAGCLICKNGMAQSCFYRVDQSLTPLFEWYRPDSIEGLSVYTIDHLRKGGLILRQIEGGETTHSDDQEQALKLKALIANELEYTKKVADATPKARNPLWRNKNSGKVYEEVMTGELKTGNRQLDGTEMVIYRAVADGHVFVSLASEFRDGRYERHSR